MELGEQLQRLREEKNLSREELAQAMNVSRQAVYKWENNK
ncbi:helix-turn-helix transcriptional regulator, partial [Priestia megaterium]